MIMQGKDVRNGGEGFAVLSLDLADSRGTTIQAMWVHTLSHGPNRLGTTMVVVIWHPPTRVGKG
jgi:hypothetical protein